MSILKSGELNKERQEHLVFDFRDVEAEAGELIESARRQAQEILAQAEEKANRNYKESQVKGYKDGHEKGLAEGLEQGREQGQKEAFEQGREEFNRMGKETLDALLSGLDSLAVYHSIATSFFCFVQCCVCPIEHSYSIIVGM